MRTNTDFIVRRLHRQRENVLDEQLLLDDLADEIISRELQLVFRTDPGGFEPVTRAELAEEIRIRVAQIGPLLQRLRERRREIALATSLLAMLAEEDEAS